MKKRLKSGLLYQSKEPFEALFLEENKEIGYIDDMEIIELLSPRQTDNLVEIDM